MGFRCIYMISEFEEFLQNFTGYAFDFVANYCIDFTEEPIIITHIEQGRFVFRSAFLLYRVSEARAPAVWVSALFCAEHLARCFRA